MGRNSRTYARRINKTGRAWRGVTSEKGNGVGIGGLEKGIHPLDEVEY